MEGLEPAHLSAPDPKSGVSTNFTTSANLCIPYTVCIRPRRGCKDKKEINNTIRETKKISELERFFLKLCPDFFHEGGRINKTFNLGIRCVDDRMAIAFPPFFTLMNKENVVSDFHDAVHVVGNDNSGDLVFLGNILNQFIDDDRRFGVEARIGLIAK